MAKVETLTIDNFIGRLTPQINGDLNSGQSYWLDVDAYDPFSKPKNLTWHEAPIQIDVAGAVITDLIMAGKVRLESGVVFLYAIGHTGRLYKIQVNDPTTYNPNYDNPVLLTTLTVGSPTFTRGAFMDFFGTTEKIYIGHDKGVTNINFDGTGEAAVSGTWTQTVPRPLRQFIGNLYVGNGTNIAEIIPAGTVSTSTRLSPAFPSSTQVRDLKLTLEGNYLQIVVAGLPLPDLTSTSPDTSIVTPTDSYVFKWNGVDVGYTSSRFYPGIILNSTIMFGDSEYLFGYDISGEAVFDPVKKIINEFPDSLAGPGHPNAITSFGNMIQWFTTLPYQGQSYTLGLQYGNLAELDPIKGFWCPVFSPATGTETDVVRVPFQLPVSNMAEWTSSSGYTDNIIGTAKIYYSTLESSITPTTGYKLYKWGMFPTGLNPSEVGVFQTQNQLFEKKVNIGQVRIYAQPWQTGVSFKVDLIGSDDQPISNCSNTFTAGSNLTVGADFAWYDPQGGNIYSMALRVTNIGDTNFVINKIEIDYSSSGI